MSDQRIPHTDKDYDLEDDLEVASHPHVAGTLRSGSAFSRGEQGWAHFDPDALDAAKGDVPAAAAGKTQAAQLRPTPLVQSVPTQRRASARQASPAPTSAAPLRRNVPAATPRNLAAAEANRAAFDARYGEEPDRGDRFSSRRRGRLGGLLAAWRERRRGARRRPHPVLRFLVGAIVALLVAYLVVCLPIDRRIAFEEPEASQVASATEGHLPLAPYYVLLLGSDAREGDEVSRSDTMILARIDVVANQVTMVSIPRDTMVELPGYGTQKINAAYAFGGTAGAIEAVERLLGVPVAEAAIVHFDGIAGLVDAMGGITVEVPVDVNDPNYTGLVMPAGSYEMDGETALLFSRVRHGFALGDYQRQADQQLVIHAIMEKARHLAPWDLIRVAGQMGPLMDTSMRCYDVMPLLARMVLGSATVYQWSLPSYTDTIGGVSYVITDDDAVATLMRVVDAGGDPADAGVSNGLEG